MLGGFLKSVQNVILANVFRLPVFQRNMAIPSSGIVGRIVSDKLFMKSNGPVIDNVLSNLLKKEISDLSAKSKYLELGYGPGNGMMTMLDKYPNTFDAIEGVDPSATMKSLCLENLKDFNTTTKINLVEGFGHSMPHIDSSSIDFIFHANVVYFWDNVDDTLLELSRVLKPTGSMASMTAFEGAGGSALDKNIFKNTCKDSYLEALERNGFRVLRDEKIEGSEDFGRELILVEKQK